MNSFGRRLLPALTLMGCMILCVSTASAGIRKIESGWEVSTDNLVLIRTLENLQPGLWLMQTHPASPTKEMESIPWWAGGDESMATHSAACMEALTSAKVTEIIRRREIELTGYHGIRDEMRQSGALGDRA